MLLKIYVLLLCSVTMALDSCLIDPDYYLKQEPKILLLKAGETAIISCTVTSEYALDHIFLRKRFSKIMTIWPHRYEVAKEYQDRLTYSVQAFNFTLTLKNLTEDDSEFYICDGKVSGFEQIHGGGTLIFVGKQEVIKEKSERAELNPMYPIIVAGCFLLFLLSIILYVRYKRLQKKKGNHSTYMDMTQTLRRNTMQSANEYCH